MTRITFSRNADSYTAEHVGKDVSLRFNELRVDSAWLARWRHDLTAWQDERGQSWDYVVFESVPTDQS